MKDYWLNRVCVALGWQGGTIHQVIAEVDRLRALEVQHSRLQELNEDLVEILGRPNFRCLHIAEVLRDSGMTIPHKAEGEQAAVLFYLLGFYLQHGSDWWQCSSDDLRKRQKGTPA